MKYYLLGLLKVSPETTVANPERSAYLFWINDGIAATREDQVGPAIALQVDKGDSLSLETWAKFEKKPPPTLEFFSNVQDES